MNNESFSRVYTEIQKVTREASDSLQASIRKPNFYFYEGESSKTIEPVVDSKKLSSYQMVIGTDRSLYGLLKKNTKIFPNGPYFMDSRDNGVSIHNMNLDQAPLLYYTYYGGNGELLSCSITTKKKTISSQAEQHSTIDPDTKDINTTVSQVVGDPVEDISLLSILDKYKNDISSTNSIVSSAKDEESTKREVRSTYKVTESDIIGFVNQAKSEFQELYKKAEETGDVSPLLKSGSLSKYVVKVKRYVKTTVDPIDYARVGDVSNVVVTSRPGLSNTDVSNYANRYNSGVNYLKNNSSIVFVGFKEVPEGVTIGLNSFPLANVVMEKEIEVELDGAKILSSPLASNLQSVISSNNLADSTINSVEADIRVIGRPSLVSSNIIVLNNISNRYSGEWYTKSVRHSISSSGYFCSAKLVSKKLQVGVSQINTRVSTKNIYSELHKAAKERIEGFNKTDVFLKQQFIEYLKSNPEQASKSNVGKIENDGISIYPASDDQININKERERYRK